MERLTLFPKLTHRYYTQHENFLANTLLHISSLSMGLSVLALLSIFLFLPNSSSGFTTINYARLISIGLIGLTLRFTLPNLIQNGSLESAKLVLITTSLILMIPILPVWNGISRPQVLVLILPIMLATQLMKQRAVLLTSLMVVGLIIVATGIQIQSESFSGRNAINDAIDVLVILSVVVLIGVIHLGGRSNDTSAEKTIASQFLVQANVLAENITGSSESQRIDQIMQAVYPYVYYLQYYKVNRAQNILERVVTLDNTPNLFQATLPLSDANPISESARIQRTIRIDTSANLNRRVNFKAGANYQVIYPIVVDRKTIGVVDLQFEAHNATSEEDLQEIERYLKTGLLMNYYASQAITTQGRVFALEEENRVLEERLAYVSLQRQGELQSVWGEYIEQRLQVNAAGFALHDGKMTLTNALPAHILATLEREDVHLERDEQGNQLLLLAVRVRGQLLVALTFTFPPTQYIGQQQITLAQRIAERLGTALQTTRLLEETQLQARREQLATEFGNLLMRSPDITALLNLATQRLNETLGAVQTQIAVDIAWTADASLIAEQYPNAHAEAKKNGDRA